LPDIKFVFVSIVGVFGIQIPLYPELSLFASVFSLATLPSSLISFPFISADLKKLPHSVFKTILVESKDTVGVPSSYTVTAVFA